MELGPRILLQRRLVLSEVVLEDVEEALVGGLGHPAVPHDERTVRDKGFCGLWTAGGSAGLLGSRAGCSRRAVALLLQRSDAQVVPRVHRSRLVHAHAARARAAGAKSRCRWGGRGGEGGAAHTLTASARASGALGAPRKVSRSTMGSGQAMPRARAKRWSRPSSSSSSSESRPSSRSARSRALQSRCMDSSNSLSVIPRYAPSSTSRRPRPPACDRPAWRAQPGAHPPRA